MNIFLLVGKELSFGDGGGIVKNNLEEKEESERPAARFFFMTVLCVMYIRILYIYPILDTTTD